MTTMKEIKTTLKRYDKIIYSLENRCGELEFTLTERDAEIAKKDVALKEKGIELDAWHSIFGTTQLTHASARLQKAEAEIAKLKSENEILKERISPFKKFSHREKP